MGDRSVGQVSARAHALYRRVPNPTRREAPTACARRRAAARRLQSTSLEKERDITMREPMGPCCALTNQVLSISFGISRCSRLDIRGASNDSPSLTSRRVVRKEGRVARNTVWMSQLVGVLKALRRFTPAVVSYTCCSRWFLSTCPKPLVFHVSNKKIRKKAQKTQRCAPRSRWQQPSFAKCMLGGATMGPPIGTNIRN